MTDAIHQATPGENQGQFQTEIQAEGQSADVFEDRPEKDGFYWLLERGRSEVMLVRIAEEKGNVVFRPGWRGAKRVLSSGFNCIDKHLSSVEGIWAGPLDLEPEWQEELPPGIEEAPRDYLYSWAGHVANVRLFLSPEDGGPRVIAGTSVFGDLEEREGRWAGPFDPPEAFEDFIEEGKG